MSQMPPQLPYMRPRTTYKKGAARIAYPTKIATCCYCGVRAALVLSGTTRHELACSSCGAPLHDLKMLPCNSTGDRVLVRPSNLRSAPHKSKKPVKKKAKRKKLRWGEMIEDVLEDAFEIIEDIFD